MKRAGVVLLAMSVCSMIVAAELFADTIYLKNGRSITGMIKCRDENRVELEVGFGVVGFKMSEVERIHRSDESETKGIHQRWHDQKIESEKRDRQAREKEEAAPKKVAVSKEASGHIIVDALINQKGHASLVFDTGASFVVLTQACAAKLGIKPQPDEVNKRGGVELIVADGRKVKAQFAMLESVSVQGNEVRNVEAAILTEDANENMKDGLLGMSFLKRFNFSIDLQNTKLTLQRL